MAEPNLFQELKDALTEFKTFLDANVPVIKPAIQALKSIIPQIGDLLDKLIDLMGKLKTAITNLNVGAIPGLDKVTAFTQGVTTLLQTAKNLLPNEASTDRRCARGRKRCRQPAFGGPTEDGNSLSHRRYRRGS